MADIRERLKEANHIEETKKPNDKERIAQLEADNEQLIACILELADIVGGGE